MVFDSRTPLVFRRDVIYSVVYLDQETIKEGLTKSYDHNGYWMSYPTLYVMRHIFGKSSHNNDVNTITSNSYVYHLQLFSCYTCHLLPERQGHGIFSPRSQPAIMVGYMLYWTRLWRIWDPAFWVVRSQQDVLFNEERNVHASCQHRNNTDIFELPEVIKYVMEIVTDGDGLLHGQAVMPTTIITHETYHKKSSKPLPKCSNHYAIYSRINLDQKWSSYIHWSYRQPTMRPLLLCYVSRIHINWGK